MSIKIIFIIKKIFEDHLKNIRNLIIKYNGF